MRKRLQLGYLQGGAITGLLFSLLLMAFSLLGSPVNAQGNGTLVGSPPFVTGKFGQAVSLNGTNQYVSLPPAVLDFAAGTSFTIEAVIKMSAPPPSNLDLFAESASSNPWYITVTNGGGIAFVQNSNVLGSNSSVNLVDGAYHTIAFVFSGGTSENLFVDGALVGTGAFAYVQPTGNLTGYLGAFLGNGNTGYYYPGQIDEVRLSSIARYSAAYTPAISAFTTDGTTTALYHLDGDASDSSVAPSTTTLPVTSANAYWSPYNWQSVGGSGTMQANNVLPGSTAVSADCNGTYEKGGFTGTSYGLAVSAGSGRLAVSVDNGPLINIAISPGTLPLATGLTAGNHTISWIVSAGSLTVTGIVLDGAASLLAPSGAVAIRPNTWLVYSDSTGAGNLVLGQPNDGDHQAAEATWIPIEASALNAEYGAVCYSGQGYESAGSGFDTLLNAWSYHSSGASRLVAGQLVPAPTYATVRHGVNGATTQADVSTMITNLTGAGAGKVLMAVPFGQYAQPQIAAAVSAQSAPNVYYVNAGPIAAIGLTTGSAANANSFDGIHPLAAREGVLAACDTQAVQSKIALGSTVATALAITITHNGSNQPVLTWTADPLATSYRVLRSVDNSIYVVIASGITGLTYTDTSEPTGTVHYSIQPVH